MEIKYYRYPPEIQNNKSLSKFSFFLLLLLLGVVLLGYIPADQNDYLSRHALLFGLPLALFGSIFYMGSYPDIKVASEGLHVEFLWMYLFVPWEDMVDVKKFRFVILDWWLITTRNRLTYFHRIHSIFVLKSFLPGFYLHPKYLKTQNDLIKLIRKHINSSLKANTSL